MKTRKPVFFPPTLMGHITSDISDLFRRKSLDANEVRVYYGCQMNGEPHLGIFTSLAAAYSIAKKVGQDFGLPSKIIFGALENGPGEKIENGGIVYQRMLEHTPYEGTNKAAHYQKGFEVELDRLSDIFNVPYTISNYRDLQAKPTARKTLLELLSREEEFTPILNPSDNRLRVRFPCGDCNYSDKHAVKLEAVGNITPQIGVFNSTCFEHGEYRTIITPDNSEYVDSNTLVRNVMKEATISKDSISEGFLPIVVKGGDWIHSSVLVSTALEMLGYGPQKRPDRIYTPLIEDWSGAKFSKSLYLEADSYDSFPAGFVSLADFERTFGEEGIRKLADHVATWVEDPKKLYRNYSLEYLIELFKK